MTLDEAFDRLIGHEGGYVNNVRDPGGETKFGISKRSYPRVNIKTLTLEDAKAIYFRDYWQAVGADRLPRELAFDLFDTAVNAGVARAIMCLQKAAGIEADGIMGPSTVRAVKSFEPNRLVARFNGHRLDHMNDLPQWPSFARGWSQRIADNLISL
jgi:lysozyme family protein